MQIPRSQITNSLCLRFQETAKLFLKLLLLLFSALMYESSIVLQYEHHSALLAVLMVYLKFTVFLHVYTTGGMMLSTSAFTCSLYVVHSDLSAFLLY